MTSSEKVLTKYGQGIKDALTPVIQTLGDVLTWLWQSVIVPVGKVLIDVLKEHLKECLIRGNGYGKMY